MVDGSTERSFSSRVLLFALVSCAILAGGLVPSSAQAMTGCEAITPTIEHVALKEITPAGAVLEAQIDPQNSATSYEFVIVQQWRNPENPSNRGELTPEGPRTLGGPIPAGAGDVTVSGLVTGLERGYIYWYEVLATNLGGETRSGGSSFNYYYAGLLPLGPGAPFTPTAPSACVLEHAKQEGERIAASAEAKRRQQEEQKAKEVAARYASEAAVLKKREEEKAAAQATPSVSLDGTRVMVQSNGMALVKLNCLGIASCHGKLTLAAKVTSKAKGKKRRSRATTIGTVGFSIAGDETETVKVDLDAAGRTLLKADRGRLSATLTVLKSAPVPAQTHSETVQLMREQARSPRLGQVDSAG
jgi:hypothetical protein